MIKGRFVMKNTWRRCILALMILLVLLPITASAGGTGPNYETIIYGTSGEGRDLVAHRFGTGSNVLVIGFAMHGYEDNWDGDGAALVYTAEKLIEALKVSSLPDSGGWTVYVLPCINPDGLYSGWTNNGPGRCTTTYLDSSGNLVSGSGIDLNRCFPTNFRVYTNTRNRTTSTPMACLEAQALSGFLQKVKGSGTNILIDVHGWYQQTITTSSRIKSVMKAVFPENSMCSSNGESGYLILYAASLGYESCLLELPARFTSMSSYVSSDVPARVIQAVEGLLDPQTLVCASKGHIRVRHLGGTHRAHGDPDRPAAV